jgi:hypothetical protein
VTYSYHRYGGDVSKAELTSKMCVWSEHCDTNARADYSRGWCGLTRVRLSSLMAGMSIACSNRADGGGNAAQSEGEG